MENIKEKKFTKAEVYEINQDINEGFFENALLLAGFVPVIGEIADVILIIKYLREKRNIEAGLMLFALIPTVGDFFIKPLLKLGRGAGAFKSTTSFIKLLSENPVAKANYLKMSKYFNNNKVQKLIGDVSKVSGKWGGEMNAAKNLHVGLSGKIAKAAEGVGDVIKTGPGKYMKKTFQDRALQKYMVKTGGLTPTNWLSRWWNVVYKGKMERRAVIKKLILGSNFLGALGIFNIESLEKKMSNPSEAEQLMQNPEFNKFITQTTTPEELQSLQQGGSVQQQAPSQSDSLGIGSAIGGFMGINTLKAMAKFV
jgi:hypothetical protein